MHASSEKKEIFKRDGGVWKPLPGPGEDVGSEGLLGEGYCIYLIRRMSSKQAGSICALLLKIPGETENILKFLYVRVSIF